MMSGGLEPNGQQWNVLYKFNGLIKRLNAERARQNQTKYASSRENFRIALQDQ